MSVFCWIYEQISETILRYIIPDRCQFCVIVMEKHIAMTAKYLTLELYRLVAARAVYRFLGCQGTKVVQLPSRKLVTA